MKKLNLGCGRDFRKGYVNIDAVKMPGVDVVHNLDKFPYPFKDNTFDEVYAAHILEHLDDPSKVLKELRRICKNNATIFIRVPFFPSMYAVSHPGHKHFFTYLTFEHFCSTHCNDLYGDLKEKDPYFNVVSNRIVYSWNKKLNWVSDIINHFPVFYQRYLAFIFPSNELQARLKVVK